MPARRESETAKGKIGMELCPPSESELLEEKKQRGKTGKAYQTGFQITEVIPSVIDSPIATYRISVGSSWEGNYKGVETQSERWTEEAKESERDVWGEEGGREERNRKITDENGKKRMKKKRKEVVHYERSFPPVYSWMIEGLIGYYRIAHCYMIVNTTEYVNRRVKSEFNTIINRDVIAEMYAWFQIRFYR